MDTLGAGYTPDELGSVIAGTKEHTPKKKRVMDAPAKPSGSLLIDIQAKLQEGKGAGYARWAKSFNLKQLSQTMIYLEENNLLDRSVLEERTAAVTAQYHTLSWDKTLVTQCYSLSLRGTRALPGTMACSGQTSTHRWHPTQFPGFRIGFLSSPKRSA